MGVSAILPGPGPSAFTAGFGVLTQNKTQVGSAPTQACPVLLCHLLTMNMLSTVLALFANEGQSQTGPKHKGQQLWCD